MTEGISLKFEGLSFYPLSDIIIESCHALDQISKHALRYVRTHTHAATGNVAMATSQRKTQRCSFIVLKEI